MSAQEQFEREERRRIAWHARYVLLRRGFLSFAAPEDLGVQHGPDPR